MTPKMRHRPHGYIMFETLVAMAILSISSFAIHRAVYQTISARREAEDLTLARYLLEHLVAKIEMRPEMGFESGQGDFAVDGHPDLGYTYEVSRIDAPIRGRAARYLNDPSLSLYYQDYIGKLTVRIFNIEDGPDAPLAIGETLLQPSQLWVPEAER